MLTAELASTPGAILGVGTDSTALRAAVVGEAIAGALVSAVRLWGEGGAADTEHLRKGTAEALRMLADLDLR